MTAPHSSVPLKAHALNLRRRRTPRADPLRERASIERDVVQRAGASYVRITVTDHTRPLGNNQEWS